MALKVAQGLAPRDETVPQNLHELWRPGSVGTFEVNGERKALFPDGISHRLLGDLSGRMVRALIRLGAIG